MNPQTFRFARNSSATWSWMVRGLIVALVAGFILPRAGIAQADTDLFLPYTNRYSCSGLNATSIPFGVQMYGNTGASSPYAVALAQTNVAWIRVSADWSAVQPDDPDEVGEVRYRWTAVDNAFRAYTDLCMNIVATIDSAPDWAAPGRRAPINADALDDFEAFVTALVERYDGDGVNDAPSGVVVLHWEIYNEPDYGDAPDGGGWGNDGAAYAAMLKRIYPAIKAASGNRAQVLFGGLAYNLFTENGGPFVKRFLPDVLAVPGACASFDYMSFHFYPNSQMGAIKTTGLPEKTQTIRALMNDAGCHKPLALTEVGWHSNHFDNPNLDSWPELQSRFVVKLLTQAIANDDMQIIIWWMLYTPNEYAYDTGLVSSDNPPVYKPAFAVFQSTVRRLTAVEYEASLSAQESGNADLEVYRFRDASNKSFYVAWLNPPKTNETRNLSLAGAQATLRDKSGNLIRDESGNIVVITDAADGVQDGKVTIPVGDNPVYIYVD